MNDPLRTGDKFISSEVMDSSVYCEAFTYEDKNGEEYTIYIDQDGGEVGPRSLCHDYEPHDFD